MMDKELRKMVNKLDMRGLKGLIKYAEQRQEKINEKQKKSLLSRFRDMAGEQGFSVDDVLNLTESESESVTATGKPRRKYAAKYANPNNSEQTWTGQGQTPVWLRELLVDGKTKDDFLIK